MASKIKIIRIPCYDWDLLKKFGEDGLLQLERISSFEDVFSLGQFDGKLWSFEDTKKNREQLYLAFRSLNYTACTLYSEERFTAYFAFDALCSKLLRCLL